MEFRSIQDGFQVVEYEMYLYSDVHVFELSSPTAVQEAA
jgi:hypothetical protein